MVGRAGSAAPVGRLAAAAVAVMLTGVVAGAPARAASGGASLKVDVSSDVQNAKAGDVVTYTVHVHNLSKTSYPHLRISHELPAGFKVVSATPRAAKLGAGPQWTVDLAPGQSLALSDTVRAGTVAEAEHLSPKSRSTSGPAPAPSVGTARTFTTTACAHDGATGATLACGDARQALADAGPAAGHGWQPGLVGLGLLAAGFGTVRGRVRKWQQRRGKG